MARFRVANVKGFWDGVQMHKQDTIIDIDPKHYDTLLHVGLEGYDDEGKKEMVKRFKDKAVTVEQILLDLNPNNPDDRRKMNEMIPHARVVEEVNVTKFQ